MTNNEMAFRANHELDTMNYDKNGRALFYLGALVRMVAMEQKNRTGRDTFLDQLYIQSEFEADTQKLFNAVMKKITEYDLEESAAWALRGFTENYTDDVQKLEKHHKQFYMVAGSTFVGVASQSQPLGVLTASEAARLWGLEASTVKKACQQGRFSPEEARKSAGTWLVTPAGMERVYGQKPIKE